MNNDLTGYGSGTKVAAKATSATYSSTANYAKVVPSTVASRLTDLENSIAGSGLFSQFESGYTLSENTDSGKWANIDITFSKEFNQIPIVVGTAVATGTDGVQTKMYSYIKYITTTGFRARVMGEGYSTARQHQFDWIAFLQ